MVLVYGVTRHPQFCTWRHQESYYAYTSRVSRYRPSVTASVALRHNAIEGISEFFFTLQADCVVSTNRFHRSRLLPLSRVGSPEAFLASIFPPVSRWKGNARMDVLHNFFGFSGARREMDGVFWYLAITETSIFSSRFSFSVFFQRRRALPFISSTSLTAALLCSTLCVSEPARRSRRLIFNRHVEIIYLISAPDHNTW